MKFDIYKVIQNGDLVYLGFKFFEKRPYKGDKITFVNHVYKVLDADEYYLTVQLLN